MVRALGAIALTPIALRANASRSGPGYIGYTEFRTNRPTRHANQTTSRACLVHVDGSGYRRVADELVDGPDTWTQFAGWSPDGRTALIARGWESPENAAWEEANKTFRMTEGWLHDIYLLDLESGQLTNVTGVERVSAYNSGVFFFPGQPNRLGFTALIDGVSQPFSMDRDGTNKTNLSSGADGFTYGVNPSPDGRYIAYHKDYQVYIAHADGTEARPIETGNPFNFVPQWHPQGSWLLFLSGEHYNCHPYLVRPDGTELHKVADRRGYTGVITVYDVYDFHGGSSDVPVWMRDGTGIYYTAKVGDAVELMQVHLGGTADQLTASPPGTFNYHPTFSLGGDYVAFGSTRDGRRQLYVMPVGGGTAEAITSVQPGHGAMWAHWQPTPPADAGQPAEERS